MTDRLAEVERTIRRAVVALETGRPELAVAILRRSVRCGAPVPVPVVPGRSWATRRRDTSTTINPDTAA